LKRVRIVITADIPGDIPDELIESMASNAEVQVLEPHIAVDSTPCPECLGKSPEGCNVCAETGTLPDGWTDLEFETVNVKTSVAIDPSPQFEEIWEWRRQVIAGKTDMGLLDWLDRPR
jgi:hypothetical protein